MSTQAKPWVTPEEYLERERLAEYKSEYYRGEVFAMAGASLRHGLIVSNLVMTLGQQLKSRPCSIYANDLRLRVTATGLYTYPDVVVIWGEPEVADDQKDTVLNPAIVIEVLSDSTKDYDRGQKFEHYRGIPSLREYLVIAQDHPHAEHYIRQPENRWLLSETANLADTIHLPAIDCTLPLAAIYDKVDFHH